MSCGEDTKGKIMPRIFSNLEYILLVVGLVAVVVFTYGDIFSNLTNL
jgi:hypothetical protein